MHHLTLWLAGFALVSFTAYHLLTRSKPKASGSPPIIPLPQPYQLPLIGRIHDLPIAKMWLKFQEWAEIHGPIYYTSMLGTDFLIISDEKIAEELLVKRGKIYSDRPQAMTLPYAKVTYLPLMGHNQIWARQRKFSHGYLTEASNARYYGIMDHEAKRWMHSLLHNPDNFQASLEEVAAKVACTLTWDRHDYSEYYAKSAWGLLTAMSPAGPLTNVITPLYRLPTIINPWKKFENARKAEQDAFWMSELLETREQMKKGLQRPCFTRKYIESAETSALTGDVEASTCLGMLALVAIFTVAGPLNYFLVAMVHHPEWQKKIQDEIDRVCGDNMPTFSDWPNLPTLRACIKETMRWKPNVPTGVAHELEADDIYRGYLIKKETRILPLDYMFLKNPTKYPDPWNFRPERWLEAGWPTFQEPLTQFPTIKDMTSFGWGQRKCLGIAVTEDETYIALGTLMACYNLKHKIDPKTGKQMPVPLDKSNDLLIIKPDPFQMTFEPRSEAKRKQIEAQWFESDAKDTAERAAFIKAATEANVALEKKANLEANMSQ